MTQSETSFLSLLFEEGRVLENLKFFPGDHCTSAEELFGAANALLRQGLEAKGNADIPVTGDNSVSVGEFVSAYQ